MSEWPAGFEPLSSHPSSDAARTVAHEMLRERSFDPTRYALCIGGNERDGFTVLKYEPGDIQAQSSIIGRE